MAFPCAALKYDGENVKAYYRKALALRDKSQDADAFEVTVAAYDLKTADEGFRSDVSGFLSLTPALFHNATNIF